MLRTEKYIDFELHLRPSGPGKFAVRLPANNRRWLPDVAEPSWKETVNFALPPSLPSGRYELAHKLGRCTPDGFHRIGNVSVGE